MGGVDPNNWVLLIIAVVTGIFSAPTWIMAGITLYYAHRTEKNTNSMKDALVAKTAAASHAEGREEGRQEGVAVTAAAATMAADALAAAKAPAEVTIVQDESHPVPVKQTEVKG